MSQSVNDARIFPGIPWENGSMLEILIIALLVWLWIIERRLNTLRDSVQALTLDVEGLRAARARAASAPSEPAGLPEVSTIHGGNAATN